MADNTNTSGAAESALQALSGTPQAPFTPSQNNTLMGANPGTPPAPAGTPSVWKTVALGALWGLAGSAGAKTFGAGAAGGAKGVLVDKPEEEARQAQAQASLQFESARAADSHILALAQAQEADTATEQHKLQIDAYKANIDAFNQTLGIKPTMTISAHNPTDMHAQAVGGLTTLAQRNGGLIPGVATVNSAASSTNQNHVIDVYAKPTPQQLQQNPNGYRKLVNLVSTINTGSPITDEQWRTGNFTLKPGNPETSGIAMLSEQQEGQAQMVLAAQQRLYGIPEIDPSSARNAATSARLKQQLDTYAARPDANQSVVSLLQQQLKTFDSAAADANSKASAAAAAAAAQTERAKKFADLDTPQGRADYAKTLQDTINAKYKNAEDHQKALFEQGVDPVTGERLNLANAPDEALIDGNTKQPIPTKMLATLKPTQQESNRADFAKSTLHTLDMLDQLKAAGKLPNGPVTGLTTKALAKAGLSSADAQEAISFIALAQSAATGAHVGGRFNVPIMEKMGDLLKLNMNSDQFSGAESALRSVMTPYAQQGGRQTVAQYKAELMSSPQYLPNGQKVIVTGFDANGRAIFKAAQ